MTDKLSYDILHGDEGEVAVMFWQMCEFDASREDWTQYSERLSHYFTANGITDAARKKVILLTVVEPAT